MENSQRFNPLSVVQTVPRQTPHQEFGRRFLEAAHHVVRQVSPLATGMSLGGPVLSAAVSGVRSLMPQAPLAPEGLNLSSPETSLSTGTGTGMEMIEAQRLMQSESQRFNVAYLGLQNEIQQESREHTTLSNVLKVRHDSAKAAINNIR